jgi:glycosyltransferase involved in cell wall biosynthesis
MLSLIITIYNNDDSLLQVLNSVKSQTLCPDEVVVINDGSTNGINVVVAELYPEFRLLSLDKNSGVSYARNYGARQSKGDTLIFLDSDIIMKPDTIEHMYRQYAINLIRGNPKKDDIKQGVDLDLYKEVSLYCIEENIKLSNKNYPFFRVRRAMEEMLVEITYETAKSNKYFFKCMAGKKAAVLKPDGELMLCEPLNYSFGNIKDNDYDILKTINTDANRRFIKNMIDSKCRCTWECYNRMNIAFAKKEYFHLLKKVISNMLKQGY